MGGTAAYAIVMSGSASELVLVDLNANRARAHAEVLIWSSAQVGGVSLAKFADQVGRPITDRRCLIDGRLNSRRIRLTPCFFSLSYALMCLRKPFLVGSIFLLLTLVLAAQEKEGTKEIKNPFHKDKSAIAEGRKLYEASCAGCHGTTGKGGRGPRLAQTDRVRNMTDKTLFDIIKDGIKGTLMPALPLPDNEIWQLVSLIRNLNASAIDEDVPGDPVAGEALFFREGNCSQCHMVRGRGGLIGPDLSNLGGGRPAERIRESVVDPSALIEPGFNAVTAVTHDGRRIEGVAKNNSNYSIQIMDGKGNFHFFLKRELKELVHHKKSLMPTPWLSESEIQGLMAFLSRQTTESPVPTPKKMEQGKEQNP